MKLYLFWAAFILLLDVSLSQETSRGLTVSIDPPEQAVVHVGQNLTVLCRVEVPIISCRVEIPSLGSLYPRPGQSAIDDIEYFGESFEAGQCGIRIASFKENYAGILKCALVPEGEHFENLASTKIIVADPPSNPELSISPGSRGDEIYGKEENLIASCRAKAGRPAAKVSLYLNEDLISNDEEPTITDESVDQNSWIVKNVSHVLDWVDNGKTLRCVVDHIALAEPLTTTKQLRVHFAPQSTPVINQTVNIIGKPGIVQITIAANPQPHFRWYVDKETIDEGHRDLSNRIQASTAMKLGEVGLWVATLRINNMKESDAKKNYSVEARNSLGDQRYQIVVSRPTKSAAGLIGRTCLHEKDCVTGGENVYCNTTIKQCACDNGFTPSVDNQRCIPGINAQCRTDQDCSNEMEEGYASMRCLMNQCVCAKGFKSFEGRCQPVGQSSGGMKFGVSVFAMACFVLLSTVL